MKTEELKPAIDYLQKIDEDDQVMIIHHWDMDGTSSATIVSKILEEIRGRPAEKVSIPAKRAYHLSDEDREKLEDMDKLIVLDFNLEAEELESLNENHADVLVVDHHNFESVPDIPFVNPRQQDSDSYIPCSKICLDISENFGISKDLEWIAGLGVIQDFGVASCPELFEEIEEDYDTYLPEKLDQQQLAKNCEFGRYSSVLNIKPYRDSAHFAKLAYEALMNSDDLKELEAQEEYRQVYEVYLEMQDEFNDAVENYEEEREIDREKMIIFFQLESDFNITSSIATNMSAKTPEWIHIVVQNKEGEINVSARCQSGRVDLGDLMQQALPEKAVEEQAEAGGHRKAAGASMQPEYYEDWKQNLLEMI